MKKLTAAIVVLAGLCGCTQWVADYRPETPEEQQAVADLTLKLVGEVPQTLSGHDQDWDDVIKAAHAVATKTACKRRYYELHWWDGYTGRMSVNPAEKIAKNDGSHD